MLDWEDLRHFLAVAEAGSLSGAARQLKVDHATVGRRVAALEDALATPLITRLARGCALTDAGQQVASLAAPMAEAVFAIGRVARGRHAPLSGRVTLSAPPAFASHFLAPRMAGLRVRHPGLTVILAGDIRAVSLGRQEADLAIRLSRPTEAGSVRQRLGRIAFQLYATPAYLAARTTGTLEFLAYDASLAHVAQQVWLRRVAGSRSIAFEANDQTSLLAAARAGMGVAALPCYVGDADPDLARLPETDGQPSVSRELWLAVHGDLRRTPAIRAVMDHLTAIIAADADMLEGRTGGG